MLLRAVAAGVVVLLLLSLTLQFAGAAAMKGNVAAATTTITVNRNGGADFRSIQEAVNSIPDNNKNWIRIHVAAGVYREKVHVATGKGYVVLQGEGALRTSVEWGDYSGDPRGHNTATSATFVTYADNFVASDITFENTYIGARETNQAVAALVAGDKSSFYRCRFIGIQDTLSDLFGRHYYRDCFVEGAFDFIFGYAQSIFEGCTLYTTSKIFSGGVGTGPGFLTAHARGGSADSGGFVFKWCNVTGSLRTYLGRAWSPFSRVIFYRTAMSDVVVPAGWDAWGATGREKDITFAEMKCSGPGSKKKDRVKWSKNHTGAQLRPFIRKSFVDTEGWIDDAFRTLTSTHSHPV